MKCSWALFLAVSALAVNAQTNSSLPDTNAGPAQVATSAPTSVDVPAAVTNNISFGQRKTEIFSESGQFNLKDRVMVYIDNVRVLDPQMKLTCGIMTVTIPESGRPERIVAERNVVIDGTDNQGKPIHATGGKAVYTYRVANGMTNETVVLTDNPRVQQQDNWMTGDEITWDRQNNSFSATHPHVVLQTDTKERTNMLAVPATNPKK